MAERGGFEPHLPPRSSDRNARRHRGKRKGRRRGARSQLQRELQRARANATGSGVASIERTERIAGVTKPQTTVLLLALFLTSCGGPPAGMPDVGTTVFLKADRDRRGYVKGYEGDFLLLGQSGGTARVRISEIKSWAPSTR